MAGFKQYLVPGDKEPTFWNRSAVLGAGIGSLIPPAIGPIGGTIGFIIGGLMGKTRMAEEAMNGKVVGEPSFFNKLTAIGAIGGLWAAAVTGLLALPAIAAVPWVGMGGLAAIAGAGALLGAVVGRAEMNSDYQEAKRYVARHGEFDPRQPNGPVQQPVQAFVITPEESRALEQNMRQQQNYAELASTLPPLNLGR